MSKNLSRILSLLISLIMMLGIVNINPDETYAAASKVKLTGAKYPSSIVLGKKYTVKGKIVSNKKIKRVEVGIVKASTNKWTKYKYDNKKVKAKTFNIKKAAKKLKFNKLAAGKYYYRIYAHTKDGAHIVLNKKFSVIKPSSKEKAAEQTKEVKVLETAITSNTEDKVTLTGYNYPTEYNVGSTYNIKGKIKCNNIIRRVEIGIVVTATNKWSEYKYDNASVDSDSFDISNAASVLGFDKLPGGEFTYRIYVHTDNGVNIALNQSFTVKPSSKPLAAIDWATKIAADNSYTYGKGYGGYFTCCVCAGKTAKKTHAKFTCMPFLAAAYAHGTNDPGLMNNGRHIMNLHDGNFKGTLGEAWFKVGLCKDLTIADLQPGDVIIKWSATNDSGHAWMYGGDDTIIEAVPADIRVLSTGAATKLRKYGSTEGTPSKNYVMRYRK